MYPFIEIFGRQLPVYALLALAGGLLAGWYVCRRVSASGLDDNYAIYAMLIGAAGALAGGHLLYGIVNYRMIAAVFSGEIEINSFRSLLGAVAYIFGGMVFYGGLFGGLGSAFLFIRSRKLPADIYSDAAAPAIPLFHVFGRTGCFMAGCCFGIESEFGFTLSHSIAGAGDAVRFPVQLLESAVNLLLFIVLDALWRKRIAEGRLLRLYFILYGTVRFADEFLRGDAARGLWFGLSTSQWISAAVAAASAASLLITALRAKRARTAS